MFMVISHQCTYALILVVGFHGNLLLTCMFFLNVFNESEIDIKVCEAKRLMGLDGWMR